MLAAPQHDMNEMPGSFSLPLQRRLQTESGSTDVTGYTDNTGEYAWLVDVTIRDQTFSLELDTGSETTWVWSNQISEPPQGGSDKHTEYDYGAISPSPVVSGSDFSLIYSGGSSGISGIVVQDTVSVAGVGVYMQFGAAQVVPGDWFYSDGLLALGWSPGNSITNKPPTFIELIQHGLDALVFTTLFDLTNAGGTLGFGAVDPTYSSSLKKLAVDNSTSSLWFVKTLSFTVGGKTYPQDTMFFDLGSPTIAIQNDTINAYWKSIPNAVRINGTNWAMPCSAKPPDLHFTSPLNGQYQHVIPGSSFTGALAYNVPVLAVEVPMCYGGLVAQSCPSGCAVMGAPFFGTHYVVWNIAEPSVSFALREGVQLGIAA